VYVLTNIHIKDVMREPFIYGISYFGSPVIILSLLHGYKSCWTHVIVTLEMKKTIFSFQILVPTYQSKHDIHSCFVSWSLIYFNNCKTSIFFNPSVSLLARAFYSLYHLFGLTVCLQFCIFSMCF
jgi:hypothetical protein